LSLEVAASLVDQFADGVCCIELAGLQDASLLPQAAASALGIAEQAGAPIVDTVLGELAHKELLIVLDNCEHLIGAAADFTAALLRASRKIRFLATSREALRIAGETVYRVPSLDAPDPNRRLDTASLMGHAAVRLFVERAQAVKRGFSLEDTNAADVAAICRRLDGIPLAIELAAGRLRTMTVAEANRRLDQRFKLLTAGQRSSLPRQQTLRALIDWSYDLLADDEKTLWRRLAVFAGGWTLSAAEAVCGDLGAGDDIADGLAALVDKSLVSVEEDGETIRYRMLQTLQEYASERLDEHAERAAAMARHLDAFLAFAEEARPHLNSSQQQAWLDRVQAEQDNIRAALAWASTRDGDVDKGMRLGVALQRFWQVRGDLTELRAALMTLLADARTQPPTLLRAKALNTAGALARLQGEFADARAYLAEGLSIMRACGDDAGAADALNWLAAVAFEQGDYPSAREHAQECLRIRERRGDRAGRATPLNMLGNIASYTGDPASARGHYEACLALCRELGDRRGVAFSLNNLGMLAFDVGDLAVARTLLEESLSMLRTLGDRRGIGIALQGLGRIVLAQGNATAALAFHREALVAQRELLDRYSIAESLEGIAAVFAELGDSVRAARLWAGAERLRLELRSPLRAVDLARYDAQIAAARRAASDATAFEQAWQQGSSRSLDAVIDDALEATATASR
jgi:predicted ATPase